MELKTFKKNITDIFISKGFSKKGSYYYYYTTDIIFVVGLQKSNYSNGYYINIGYIIKKLNPDIINPRDVDGDIRARFSLENEDVKIDYFDLDDFLETDQEKLQKIIESNINKYIKPVTSLSELKALLDKNTVMLYQTKLSAKEFLGFA
jgi:hypothetical protein